MDATPSPLAMFFRPGEHGVDGAMVARELLPRLDALAELAFSLTNRAHYRTMLASTLRRALAARRVLAAHVAHVLDTDPSPYYGDRLMSCPFSLLAWTCGHRWAASAYPRPDLVGLLMLSRAKLDTTCYHTGAFVTGETAIVEKSLEGLDASDPRGHSAAILLGGHVGAALMARDIGLATRVCQLAARRYAFPGYVWGKMVTQIVHHTHRWLDGLHAMRPFVDQRFVEHNVLNTVPTGTDCDWTMFEAVIAMTPRVEHPATGKLFAWAVVSPNQILPADATPEAVQRVDANVTANVHYIEKARGVRLRDVVPFVWSAGLPYPTLLRHWAGSDDDAAA